MMDRSGCRRPTDGDPGPCHARVTPGQAHASTGTLLAPAHDVVRIAGLLVVLAACGARVDAPDQPDAGGDDVDGRPTPDATPVPPDAVADNACGVAAAQGDIGVVAAVGSVESVGDNELLYKLGAPTPATAMQAEPDVIYIELWDDYGVFLDDRVEPGTYEITGEELEYATCGVCVFTLADLAGGQPTRTLLATGGTVIIHAVGAEQDDPLEVEVLGVTFREVDPDDGYDDVGSSCASPLDHGRLDGTIADVMN
jgi:hypothetical protein